MEVKELIDLINKKGKVYLAGGWFNPEQLERLEFVRDSLKEIGFDVFSPKDENLAPPDGSGDVLEAVYSGNLKAIENASFMFCITNCKDMGTLHESGYASAKNVPIIYFAEGLNGPFNLMLARSGIYVITKREDISRSFKDIKVLSSILSNSKIENNYKGDIE